MQLDPLTRGAMFHEVQRDVLRGLQARRPLPVTAGAADADRRRSTRRSSAVAAQHHERLAPAIERVWDDEIARCAATCGCGCAVRRGSANGCRGTSS